jgi:hypothetical protein
MMKHRMRLALFRRGNHQNVYGVEVYRGKDGSLTVVLSEIPENHAGTSITNAIEHVATDVLRGLLEHNVIADPNAIVWIEHYPDRQTLGYASADANDKENAPTWDRVHLHWNGERYCSPRWYPFNGNRYQAPDFADYDQLA